MPSDRVQMFCDGLDERGYNGYNAHRGSTPYIVVVPFEDAIKNPPRCALHDRPYLTTGGYRLSKLADRIRSHGAIEADCEWSYGGSAWCVPHDSYERDADDHCSHWRLAQWLIRRHEYGASLAEQEPR